LGLGPNGFPPFFLGAQKFPLQTKILQRRFLFSPDFCSPFCCMKKQPILPKFWLRLKPYATISAADVSYIRMANGLLDIFVAQSENPIIKLFPQMEELQKMACFFVGYLEDKASEIGMFDTFRRLHHEKYGKPLPFYRPGADYDLELLNLEDIQFLLWYFVNRWNFKSYTSPLNNSFYTLSVQIFTYLEDHWETAPENTNLQQAYKIQKTEPNYYDCRQTMQQIALGGYLFIPDVQKEWQEEMDAFLAVYDGKDPRPAQEFIKEIGDSLTNKGVSRLMGISFWEWAREFYKNRYPRAEVWFDFQGKTNGVFQILEIETDFVSLKHLPTEETIKVLTWTMPTFQKAKRGDYIYIGLAMYHQNWHFSGILLECPAGREREKLLEATEDQLMFQMLVPGLKKEMFESQARQNKDFKKFQPNGPLVFISNADLPIYNQRFMESMVEQDSKKGNEKEEEQSNYILPNSRDPNDPASNLLFYNPDQGMEMHPGPHVGIPHPLNQSYDPKQDQERAMRLFLLNDGTSVALCEYILQTYRKTFSFLKADSFRPFIEDRDFLYRFRKGKKYHVFPRVLLQDSF
jgi:hypothetical protein